jgi:hypothetical protein
VAHDEPILVQATAFKVELHLQRSSLRAPVCHESATTYCIRGYMRTIVEIRERHGVNRRFGRIQYPEQGAIVELSGRLRGMAQNKRRIWSPESAGTRFSPAEGQIVLLWRTSMMLENAIRIVPQRDTEKCDFSFLACFNHFG